jgi:hypothetical protein
MFLCIGDLVPVTAGTVFVVTVPIPFVTMTGSSGESTGGRREDKSCEQEVFHTSSDATYMLRGAQACEGVILNIVSATRNCEPDRKTRNADRSNRTRQNSEHGHLWDVKLYFSGGNSAVFTSFGGPLFNSSSTTE